MVQSIQCASKETLCLSLDWSNRRIGESSSGSLIVSLSDGQLCLLTPSESAGLEVQEKWHAHDYEPWTAAWNYFDSNVIYSGGDDLRLKAWDIRQGFFQPIFVNKRFDAGVTAIQSHPFVEHLFAVGRLVVVPMFLPISMLLLYHPATTTQSGYSTHANH